MKNKLLKKPSLFITPILILFLLIVSLNNYSAEAFSLQSRNDNPVLCNSSKSNNIEDYYSDIELVPGGESVGIKLACKGVLVVGYAENERSKDPMHSDIYIGDIITKVNSESVSSSKELINKIKNSKDDYVEVTLVRNNKEQVKDVKIINEDNNKKLGLWVRDTTAGVGTMTFYSKDKEMFGALGHPVIDNDTNECFAIKGGNLMKSCIISVKKGEKGAPGELKGIFIDDECPLGSITTNCDSGIFGSSKSSIFNNKSSLKVGFRNEIQEGPAKIITTIDEDGPKEYDIVIEKLFVQDEPGSKSMIIRVTDEELLEKTGGIVQGMSGSPIIQNNKIVGAVTHVLINKPSTGYGIYIDWMLKECGII